MKCKLVDVFADKKFEGNGLTIFYDFDRLSNSEMLSLTREMRQFESIFLQSSDGGFRARIFTMEEELDFAGHPLLGLCLHLHEEFGNSSYEEWTVTLNTKSVQLSSLEEHGVLKATMSQGRPVYAKTLTREEARIFYEALNLNGHDKPEYPAEVISTGLPYVILPVAGDLETITFKVPDLSPFLEKHGAKFIYVLDVQAQEGRTWDNSGKTEDIATGSAAGPAGAYLYKHGLMQGNRVVLNQGRFVGRPSKISVELIGSGSNIEDIKVSGSVVKVADIHFV